MTSGRQFLSRRRNKSPKRRNSHLSQTSVPLAGNHQASTERIFHIFFAREEFTFCFYRWFLFGEEGGVLYVDIPG